jgi:hypothetical protein
MSLWVDKVGFYREEMVIAFDYFSLSTGPGRWTTCTIMRAFLPGSSRLYVLVPIMNL